MQPPPPPIVSLDRVTFQRDGRDLFAGACWELLPGQQWAIVGGNGSGKTTFADGLAGHLPVVRGRLRRQPGDRRPIVHVSFETQRRLVTGHSSFHQARWFAAALEGAVSVEEALSRPFVEGVSRFQVFTDDAADQAYRRRLAEAIDLLQIAPLLPKRVMHLSNGETRKLLLARALVRDPQILILDDPAAGLDVGYRTYFQSVMAQLVANGHALLLLTRDFAELPPHISHVLLLDNMRITWQGPREAARFPEPVAHRPRSPVRQSLPPPPPAPDPFIDLRDVTVTYGGSRILDRVSWRVRRGESWALLGPNGAGKSTLLSLILADNPQAYANDVRLFGRRRGSGESIWDIKRLIGWVAPEMQAHYATGIACHDVVCSGFADSIGVHTRVTPDQAAATADWLARLGLTERGDTPFGSLSAGEQRLTLLARAMVKNPPLLILDEPCQGLDPAHTAEVVALIDHLARQPGRTVICVSHHPEEMPPSIACILRLENGRMAGG